MARPGGAGGLLLSLIVPAMLVLSPGCASRERAIAGRLTALGLPPVQADCMAGTLVARLSTAQLRQLDRAAQLVDEEWREELTLRDLARSLTAIRDPEILSVLARAAAGCALAGRGAPRATL